MTNRSRGATLINKGQGQVAQKKDDRVDGGVKTKKDSFKKLPSTIGRNMSKISDKLNPSDHIEGKHEMSDVDSVESPIDSASSSSRANEFNRKHSANMDLNDREMDDQDSDDSLNNSAMEKHPSNASPEEPIHKNKTYIMSSKGKPIEDLSLSHLNTFKQSKSTKLMAMNKSGGHLKHYNEDLVKEAGEIPFKD